MIYIVDKSNLIKSKYTGQQLNGKTTFDDTQNQIADIYSNGLPTWKVANGILTATTPQDFNPHPEYQPSLSGLKSKLISEIDQKTQDTIFTGFSHGGKIFSMSLNAQVNWLGLETLASSLTYPYTISTKFNEDYALNDVTGTNTLTEAAKSHKDTAIVAGRAQKNLVMAMVTLDQLKAYTDPR